MQPDPQNTFELKTFRSPFLLNVGDSALLIIDVQEKLLPLIPNHLRIQWNIGRLIRGAQTLGVPIAATEQYPQGLGRTVVELRDRLATAGVVSFPEKTMFSCRECATLLAELGEQGINKLVLTGIETHVCVAQTALDLTAAGFNVYLAVDAVGARGQLDHDTAIRRLENSGVVPTTTEAILFEWCEQAGSESFKKISQLVRENAPT